MDWKAAAVVWSPQNPFDEFWTLWNFFLVCAAKPDFKKLFFCRDPLADTLIKKSHVSQENFAYMWHLDYGVLQSQCAKNEKKVQQIKMPVGILV